MFVKFSLGVARWKRWVGKFVYPTSNWPRTVFSNQIAASSSMPMYLFERLVEFSNPRSISKPISCKFWRHDKFNSVQVSGVAA